MKNDEAKFLFKLARVEERSTCYRHHFDVFHADEKIGEIETLINRPLIRAISVGFRKCINSEYELSEERDISMTVAAPVTDGLHGEHLAIAMAHSIMPIVSIIMKNEEESDEK